MAKLFVSGVFLPVPVFFFGYFTVPCAHDSIYGLVLQMAVVLMVLRTLRRISGSVSADCRQLVVASMEPVAYVVVVANEPSCP